MVAVRTRVLSAELSLFAAFLFSMLVLSWSNAMAAGKENFSIPDPRLSSFGSNRDRSDDGDDFSL